MSVIALARWTGAHALRRPSSWMWLIAVAAIWPAFLAFAPRSLTAYPGEPRAAIYEIAFVSLLLGHAVGRAALDRAAWLLSRAGPGRRLWAEGVALSAAAAPFVVLGLAPVVASGELDAGALAGIAGRVLAAHAQLTALSAFLSGCAWSATARPAVLVVAAWVLPALCAGAGAVGDVAVRDLGVAYRLEAESVSDAWKAAAGPIIGWLAAAALLHARPNSCPTGARS